MKKPIFILAFIFIIFISCVLLYFFTCSKIHKKIEIAEVESIKISSLNGSEKVLEGKELQNLVSWFNGGTLIWINSDTGNQSPFKGIIIHLKTKKDIRISDQGHYELIVQRDDIGDKPVSYVILQSKIKELISWIYLC